MKPIGEGVMKSYTYDEKKKRKEKKRCSSI
jgi:hypothetical protein